MSYGFGSRFSGLVRVARGRRRAGDGVEGGQAVVCCRVEVAANAAPAGEGSGLCQYPETAWWRLAALTACSEQLFVQSTAGCG